MDMSKIDTSLTSLEARLRTMVEGDAGKAGIPRKLYHQVLDALVHAMLEAAKKRRNKEDRNDVLFIAPDQYTIVLPVEQANILINHPAALDRLVQKMLSSAAQAGLHFTKLPILRVVPDPKSQELHILVDYCHFDKVDSYTSVMEGMPVSLVTSSGGLLPKAFLIVNGLSPYPLSQVVINIGCDPSNQLVLDNPGVSRIHAQLRFIKDRFVIFDLDSKHGTIVNGTAISSHALIPGDVIMLAGVPLVFGLETESPLGYTQELPPEPPVIEVLQG
jgi:hypothetical protein